MKDYEKVDVEVVFAPSETIKAVEVKIIDEMIEPMLEGEESFELQLSMPENAKLGIPDKTNIVIDDSDLDGKKCSLKLYFIESRSVSLKRVIVSLH